jgi:hypothetical protein
MAIKKTVTIHGQRIFDLSKYNTETIENLRITNCTFDVFPQQIIQLKKLKKLDIENTPIKNLPADIHLLTNLQELKIHKTAITELPSSITALEKLNTLHITSSKLTVIPDFLSTMSRLYYMDMSDNPLVEFPMFLFQMPYLSYCKCSKISIFHANFSNAHKNTKFFYALGNISRQKRANTSIGYSMYLLLSNEVELCKNIPLEHLLEILGLRNKLLKTIVLEVLQEISAAYLLANPLQKGSKIAIMGKLQQDKAALNDLLQMQGVSLEARISNQATHFLLGDTLTGEHQKKLQDSKKPFLFLPQLTRFLESKETFFLVPTTAANNDDAATQAKQLSALLLSTDEANVQLACEIMNNNGVPQSLITPLFLVAKNPDFSLPIRANARKLLERNASPAISQKVKSSRMLSLSYFDENAFHFFFQDNHLDAKIGYQYYKQNNKFKYELFHDEYFFDFLPEADLKEIYLNLLQQPNFVLDIRFLGVRLFKKIIDWQQPKRLLTQMEMKMPNHLFEADKIEALELKMKYYIYESELKKLDKFPHLSQLTIWCKAIKTMPKVLYDLPTIKKITLDVCQFPNEEIDKSIFEITNIGDKKILTRI